LAMPQMTQLKSWQSLTPSAQRGAVKEWERQAQTLRWQARYLNDPIAFVHDHLTWEDGKAPTAYQQDILAMLVEHKRVAVRSPHSAGKSALAAWVVLWRALTWDSEDDWKAPTLASVWRQLSAYLWPEVHKWARQIKWAGTGREAFTQFELLRMQLNGKTGQAFALASNDHTALEGAHSDRMSFCFDESKAIPDDAWDAVEGALVSGDAHWLAISTPGPPRGRFYEIHSRAKGYEDWAVRSVTIDEMIRAGRIDPQVVADRERQWGSTSAVFRSRMLGEFSSEEDGGLVPLSWIDEAQERYRALPAEPQGALVSVGVDVGGGGVGGDSSVICLLFANGKVLFRKFGALEDPGTSTMELVGHIVAICERHRPRWVVVDAIGIGAGVVHRLREEGIPVLAFNAAARCDLRDRSGELGFAAWRSAGWWVCRESLEPGSGINLALPDDADLIGELTSPSYRMNSTGKIQVEEKDSLRGRLHRSTDTADSLIMALCAPLLAQEDDGGTRRVVVDDGLERLRRY
jgi:hypothetical protein